MERAAKENARLMARAAKEAARAAPPMATRVKQALARLVKRPAPLVATRAKQTAAKPKRKPTRRRFNIALPKVPRPNMRSIRIPRPRFGWRLLSFILAAIFGAALYLAFNRPELRMTEAKIIGNQLISAQEVNSVLNVAGQPIFLLTPADLETRVRLNFPELISVNVTASLPNLVFVNVAERQPIIRWEQGGGYTWIAEDGVAFRPRGEMLGLISVVALSGHAMDENASSDPLTPAPFISTEMVQAVKGLASHVPPGESILYDVSLGFGWNDPRGWRVYFGTSANDLELKMRVYEAMVNSLTQRGIRPAFINVTYPTAPYYRMSQ